MSATIKDIAKRVGVNPSTVSRVINGTASISDETKQKIKTAMKELDYHPNGLARSLVSGSTSTIGLVFDAGNEAAFSNTFFIRSVAAIEAVAQKKGFNVLVTNDSLSGDDLGPVEHLVFEKKIDGLILPFSENSDKLIDFLMANDFPFVVMGEPERKDKKISWVDMDNEDGGCLAVNHLLKAGYKHPVLFVENKGTVFEKKRIAGFKKGFEINNVAYKREYIVECSTTKKEISEAVARIMEYSEVDSIICTNNVVAYNVLKELRKRDIRVPKDMGVMTFDNYPLAEYMDPPLTAVDIDTYKMGDEAANVLFNIIKKRREGNYEKLVSTRIIERKSTKK